MAATPPDDGRDDVPAERQPSVTSDLIGVKLTLFLAVGFLAVLAAFFFVGPVAGIVVLLGGVAVAGLASVAAIRRADEPD